MMNLTTTRPRKNAFLTIKFCLLLLMMPLANADISIVVNPSVAIDSIPPDQFNLFYLAKSSRKIDGVILTPLDIEGDVEVRTQFHRKVLRRSVVQAKAYWARLIFTGKGQPPELADSEEDLIDLIENNTEYIGYINSENLTSGLKEVLRISQ